MSPFCFHCFVVLDVVVVLFWGEHIPYLETGGQGCKIMFFTPSQQHAYSTSKVAKPTRPQKKKKKTTAKPPSLEPASGKSSHRPPPGAEPPMGRRNGPGRRWWSWGAVWSTAPALAARDSPGSIRLARSLRSLPPSPSIAK